MRSVGLDVDAICAAAGVSEAALADRTDPLTLEELVPLWRAAVKQFGRGTLGLHVGAAMPQETLLEYVAGASPNLRAALGQIARYIGLATRNVSWVVGVREADGLTTFEERATFAPTSIPIPVREFGLALTTSRIRGWFDRRPREVWFAHPAQGPVDEYQEILGCPVRFERDRMALRFDDEALAAPASRHDPHLFRLLESHAQRVLAETPVTASFRERVRREVVQRLREGEPGDRGHRPGPGDQRALAAAQAAVRGRLVPRRRRRGPPQARRRLPGRPQPLDDRRRLPARLLGGGGVHARVQALDRPRAQPGPRREHISKIAAHAVLADGVNDARASHRT